MTAKIVFILASDSPNCLSYELTPNEFGELVLGLEK
jgi:hypothetical protein